MAFDNSTISQPDLHMNAASGRKAIGNHAGERVNSKLSLSKVDTETLDKKFQLFKCSKAGYVHNFALRSDDLSAGADIVLEIGDGTTDAKFMTSAVGQAGGLELTNVADAPEQGLAVAAGEVITLNIGTAAATGAAGDIELAFDYWII